MAFGRTSNVESVTGKPPLFGSFPIDHEGECKEYMKQYMKCMKENKNNNGECRKLSRAYLQCRMDKNLMDKEDLNKLGFADLDDNKKASSSS
ncbi:cytochrome c oxidase assembly protein COX19-like protein [Syncephalastrum racemosum]|uniref:Cytochrome c oxidase assembly protein COX19 n=1 Tax=Syncephalastrum racemosum TaxID=13706 RepID=A0A1X2HKJ7_SYNRA|nr:cytochrome c oxidase assembly protein COX19-like protein [Syncephalastrum racemosum]